MTGRKERSLVFYGADWFVKVRAAHTIAVTRLVERNRCYDSIKNAEINAAKNLC